MYFNINFLENKNIYNDNIFNLENFDDIKIIKRTPIISQKINNIIDKKNFLNNEEKKLLKNSHQIFLVNNDNESNISNLIYNNNDINKLNNYDDFNDNLIDISDKNYDLIKNKLKNDIKKITEPNCFNTGVLKNNLPFAKNYLKNYYRDIFGNNVQSNLSDYFSAYYTLINENDNIGLSVSTKLGKSNFLIPDQYNTDKHFTNAYNIDWDKIINPIGYSM